MTLHEAPVLILQENTNQPMTVRQLADAVTERGLDPMRDGSPGEVKKEHAMSGPGDSRASRRAARRADRRHYPPRGLHLIDVENLAGTATPDPAQGRHLQSRYLLLAGVGTRDHVVIASSHLALKKAGCWWPGARYLVRSGPDGADLALLDLVGHERIAERFAQVTIASGDGMFALAAASLAVAGCQVSVISRRAGLSRNLALAVGWNVTYIDPPDAWHAPIMRPPATGRLSSSRRSQHG